MAVDKKISALDAGGEAQVNDEYVTVRAGENFRIDFPGAGIKDANANFMVGWSSPGAAAVNYPQFESSITTDSVKINAIGSDADISVEIIPKGVGNFLVNNLAFRGNTISSTDTGGDINITPDTTGDIVLDGQKWPQSDGAANTVLTTDGAGQTSWSAASFPIAVGATGTVIRSNGTNWVASTSTFADTYAINTILFASAANTVTGLATANSAMIRTNASGVPSWSASMIA